MLEKLSGNTGTRGAGLLLLHDEIVSVLVESRWCIIFLLLLIIADFWYAKRESTIRYKQAKEQNDSHKIETYKWRTSRAIRRTCNKFIDYIILISFGPALGMALFEPIGISHIFGIFIASLIAFFCEIQSLGGHFLFVKGIKVEKKTFMGFTKAFLVAFTKSKNEDVGNALEKGFEKMEEKA